MNYGGGNSVGTSALWNAFVSLQVARRTPSEVLSAHGCHLVLEAPVCSADRACILAAEECEQRIAAGEWEAAHALFTQRLAPRWWLAGQHRRLRSQLQPLLQATQEAQAQVDPLQWQTGAELYATFFTLKVRRQQGFCRAGSG